MIKKLLKAGLVALMLEGVVRLYGLFAHGVQSFDMEIIPAVALAGIVVILVLQTLQTKKEPWSHWFSRLAFLALAIWINALFIEGVLDIAGGSSAYTSWLTNLAILMAIIAFLTYLIRFCQSPNDHKKSTAI